ncbi:MAG TPA: hypothetical protein VFV99_31265 [Kofleriaceae bacterium]|nr:hypothetical protein [Kofleriaceae bacterium]
MSAKHKWIAAIVGLLVANVLAMVFLIVVANGEGHSKVLPSYKGVIEKTVVEKTGGVEKK